VLNVYSVTHTRGERARRGGVNRSAGWGEALSYLIVIGGGEGKEKMRLNSDSTVCVPTETSLGVESVTGASFVGVDGLLPARRETSTVIGSFAA